MNRLIFSLAVLLLPQVIMGSDLTTAILSTNIVLAKQLILAKRDINTQDQYGGTPLIYAAIRGHVDLCEMLITNGAAVDVEDENGFTALDFMHGAPPITPEAKKQISQMLEQAQLAQHGKVIVVDSTAAREKLLEDEIEMRKEAIKKSGLTNLNVEFAAVNAQDVSGKTLLMQYAEVGDTNACRYLLEHGAKADIKDRTGKTVVDYICAKVEKPDDKLKSQILSLLKPSEAKPSQ